MSSIETLPDWGHIKQLREHLWCDREFGKAAIMVGAGFSRNAKRISSRTPLVPLWRELAELMYDSLYPPKTPPEEYRKKNMLEATSGVGALRLASEYEAYFDRQTLDEFIKESIPDTSYSPGELHELLLNLPWSDVFTTNYDTLLEQTLPVIHDRKYDIVLTTLDIPGKMKPRLVKLHGSFPSNRPFIITEEDYRTYPKKFAPFVNMVQQSMIENAFCLIGFSGDDPNFLHWAGWVRDNLGPDAPRIYLCGLLNLSVPQRQVLKNKGIIPIDLSPLISELGPPNHDSHEKALKEFLKALKKDAPNVRAWPNHSDHDNHYLHRTPLQTEKLKELYKTWSKKRREYPGWVVAPMKNRDELMRVTEYWIEPVLQSIEELSPPENLFLLYELNWRLETALISLFVNRFEKIAQVIETFNPYPKLVEIKGATIVPNKDGDEQWDWKSIGECWVELAFALARKAREDQDENLFRLWMDRLTKVVKQRTDWQAQWFYEECLFYLFRFDQEKIREVLEDWPETSDLPFWGAKRASILAELGELKEAERIAEDALTEIRSQIQPYTIDYSLFSQEGWVMLLLSAIKHNEFDTKIELEAQYRDRWAKIEAYRCSPWPDIDTLELILNRPRPVRRPEKGLTITCNTPSGLNIPSDILPSFAFLRMFEEGAVPIKCGYFTISSYAAVVNAAKWIAPYAPFWSFSSMVRAGSPGMVRFGGKEGIWEFFDRVRVATLTQDEVIHFSQICANSLRQAIRHLEGNPQQINLPEKRFLKDQVQLQSEFLSRLCFRFSIEQLDQLFDLTVDMYKLPIFRHDHSLHNCVNIRFQILLFAMPQSEILQRIPELLSLPIPTELGFEVAVPTWWDEPFCYIEWLEDTELDPGFDRSAWSAPIANLIRVVKDGDIEARTRASNRLSKIHEIDRLTNEESDAFGEALWSRIDRDTGLPSDTGFYSFEFLHLPETKKGIAKENFRKYILSTDFPRVVERSIAPNGKESKRVHPSVLENCYIQEWLSGTVPLFPKNEKERRLVDWTTDEIIQLLIKANAWWNDEKVELQTPIIAYTVKSQFSGLVQLVADVILPKLADSDDKTNALAGRLLSDMGQSDFCVLSALPMTLYIDLNSYDEIAQKLRYGLGSTKEEEVHGSTLGIFNWIVHASKGNISPPPNDLLNELVNRVFSRSQPRLDSAILYVSDIVRRLPDILNESQMKSLCIALEYLIKDTELPEIQDQDAISRVCLTISINERPEYRKLAAELAYRIFVQFTSKNKEIPQILIDWNEICKNDPLPEVRRVWR
ncbi:MAG: SIR2 family NAD-dependent protein deacylase [Candidatus Methanogasteraceae archaeon]